MILNSGPILGDHRIYRARMGVSIGGPAVEYRNPA